MKNKYTIIDLFAGSGGLSLGFLNQGDFRVVGLVEKDNNARSTYLNNCHPEEQGIIIEKDINNIDYLSFVSKTGKVDVVIGGPPCQGFSNANRQHAHLISHNNALIKKYVEAVTTILPKVFLLENVSMLKSKVHKFFCTSEDEDCVEIQSNLNSETLLVYDNVIDGEYAKSVFESEQTVINYSFSEDVFRKIKIISKRLTQSLHSNFDNYCEHSKHMICYLKEYLTRLDCNPFNDELSEYVETLITFLEFPKKVSKEVVNYALKKMIYFQKALSLMSEIYGNHIVIKKLYMHENKVKIDVKSYSVIDYLTAQLSSRYFLSSRVLNTADYGVPQERNRFILVGISKQHFHSEDDFVFPRPVSQRITVKEAIEDLEKYDPSTSVTDPPISRQSLVSNDSFIGNMQANMINIFNHVIPNTREKSLERFRSLNQGENFHSLPAEYKDNYTDVTKTQNSIYKRLTYSETCGTVVNVRKSMWIHPVQNRAISIREAARLQSFPDSFIFYGSKDSQYQQVGNAVPPVFSEALADQISKLLNRIN